VDQAKAMAGGMGGAAGGLDSFQALLGEADTMSAADFDISILDPTTATAAPKGAGDGLTFKKTGSEWKLDLQIPSIPGMAEGLGPLEEMGQIGIDIAGEINAGKYPTANEMSAAMNQRVMPILAKMFGGAGGPGGPGGGRPPRKPPPGGGG
jgi:hypothetical protein